MYFSTIILKPIKIQNNEWNFFPKLKLLKNKKFHYKRASPSFISHLYGRKMQIKTPFSRGKLLTQASSEKYASKFYNITTAI